jgi:hypothetical protein
MTCMLAAIIMYNYAIFAFLFMADNYTDGSIGTGLLNKNGASICMTLLHCFFSVVNYGLRNGGGIGEAFPPTTYDEWNRPNYYLRFFYDLSFFLVITTIILNVIFGIIIDSFA